MKSKCYCYTNNPKNYSRPLGNNATSTEIMLKIVENFLKNWIDCQVSCDEYFACAQIPVFK